MELTGHEFRQSIWSQHDSGGYGPSGWLCGVHGKIAYIAQFSHCSCYGTWEAVVGADLDDYGDSVEKFDPDWTGTLDELMVMADRQLDPAMPSRKIDGEDWDAAYLMAMYDEVLRLGQDGVVADW